MITRGRMDENAGIVQSMGEQRLESTMEEQEEEKEEKGKEEEEKGKKEEEKEGGEGEEEVKEKDDDDEEEEEEEEEMSESDKSRVGGQGGDAKRPPTLVHLQAGLSMFGSTPRDRSSVRPSSSSSKARLLGLEYPDDTGHHTRANDFANAIALEDDERRGSDGPRRVKIRETQRAKSAGAFKYTRGGSPLVSGGCHVGDSLESHQPEDPWQGGAPSMRRPLNIDATASTRRAAAQPSRLPKSPGRPATAQPCGGIVQPPPDPPPQQQRQQQQQPCGGQGASFLPANLEVLGTHKQDWHSFHSPRQVQSARGRTLKSCATGNWHHREDAHFDQPDEAAGRGSPEVEMLNDDGTPVVWRQWKQSSSAVGLGAFSKSLRARPASGLLVSPSRPKTATVASLVVSSPRTRPAPPTTSRGPSARASPTAVRGKSAGPMQSKSSKSSSTSRIATSATSATSRIDTRATSATVRVGGQAVWDATTPGHRKLAHQSHARVTHGGRGREISLVPRHLDAPTGARVAEVSRYQRIGHHSGLAAGGAARGIEFLGLHQVLARDEIVASKVRIICDVEAQLGLV